MTKQDIKDYKGKYSQEFNYLILEMSENYPTKKIDEIITDFQKDGLKYYINNFSSTDNIDELLDLFITDLDIENALKLSIINALDDNNKFKLLDNLIKIRLNEYIDNLL